MVTSILPPSLLALPPYATTSPLRLQALYSDISRQKHSNPTSYQSSIEWWRKTLQLIVSSGLQQDSGSRLTLSAGRSLMERVKLEGVGKPLALGAVVSELRNNKSLILQSDFLNGKDSIYDPGWLPGRIAAFVVGKPLWWALEQLGVVGEDGIFGGAGSGGRSHKDTEWWGEYVVVSLVEEAADKVLARQSRKVAGAGDMLYRFDAFRREFGSVFGTEADTVLTERDARVLLRYLERDRKALVIGKDVIKFITDDGVSKGSRGVTPVDEGILELKSAVDNLHAQIEGLQHKIDECTQKASAALLQKRKPVALGHLRSRKQLEDLLAKRLGSLGTLESTLISVEAAAGDVEIMKSYESSTTTLRAILAHPSLQRESIEATMDALAEMNADAREVDEAVRTGGDVAIGIEEAIDDSDLEDELRGLIEEAEKEMGDADKERESEGVTAKLEGDGMEAPAGVVVKRRAGVPATIAT